MKIKSAAFIASAAVIFSLTSCGDDDTVSDISEIPEVTEISEISDPVDFITDGEEDDGLIYDFTGLDSEKAISAITSDKYHMVFTCDYDGQDMKRDIYYNTGSSVLDRTYFMNMDYSTVYSDGTKYNVIDDIYFSSPVPENDKTTDSYRFEGYGYTGSGETEFEGKKYKYDEFSQGYEDSVMKLLLNEDNSLYAIVSDGSVMYIEVCDADFDPAKVIKIPDGLTEVSENDFNTIFLDKVLSNTESSDSEGKTETENHES